MSEHVIGICELKEVQLARIEALGFTLDDAYQAVNHYTDGLCY